MKIRYAALTIASVVLIGVALMACSKARDDAAIASDVRARISSDVSLSGKPIAVQSSAGVVTLSGTVSTDSERAAAENAAKQVRGVKSVTNNLQVVPAVAAQPVEQPAAPQPAPARKPVVKKTAKPAKPAPVMVPAATVSPATGIPEKAPELATVTIPEGTNLSVRLIDPVDTAKNKEGDTFRASLDAPIIIAEQTVVPKNSDVEVKLVSAKSAGHFTGSSAVVLVVSKMAVGGKSYEVQTGEFTKKGASRGKRTAAVVGGGAAAGAVIGGIVGGGKGAAIGAAAGAGAGTGVQAATKGQQVRLPSETVLEFQLKAPVTVSPAPESTKREKAG
ncbi:MAG: BON domain-containing protein [Terriglobales bacterium]